MKFEEISNKKFKEFLKIIESYGEPLFGTKKQIKEQLEIVLGTQGYWSGIYIKVYYDMNKKEFSIIEKSYI